MMKNHEKNIKDDEFFSPSSFLAFVKLIKF